MVVMAKPDRKRPSPSKPEGPGKKQKLGNGQAARLHGGDGKGPNKRPAPSAGSGKPAKPAQAADAGKKLTT